MENIETQAEHPQRRLSSAAGVQRRPLWASFHVGGKAVQSGGDGENDPQRFTPCPLITGLLFVSISLLSVSRHPAN